MKKYWVTCDTVTYGNSSILVEAKNKKQAQEIGEEGIMTGLGEDNHSQVEVQNTEVVEE